MEIATEVDLAEFDAAVRKMTVMKRAPRGARGTIPSDTLLSADPNGIFVETPVMSTLVLGSPGWPKTVSVNARKLVGLCDTIKKIIESDKKKKLDVSSRLRVGTLQKEFFLQYANTRLSLPLLQLA